MTLPQASIHPPQNFYPFLSHSFLHGHNLPLENPDRLLLLNIKENINHKTAPEELCCFTIMYSQIITALTHHLEMIYSFPVLTSVNTKHHLCLPWFLVGGNSLTSAGSNISAHPSAFTPATLPNASDALSHVLFWECPQVKVELQQTLHKSKQ